MARIATFLLALLLAPAFLAPCAGAGEDLADDDRGGVKLKSDLDEEARDAVHELVLETRARVQETLRCLGLAPKSRGQIRLRIYAAPEDFASRQRRTQSIYMLWTNSYFDLANNEVVSCWQGGSAQGRAALRHELTHCVLHEYSKNLPLWFAEGFACYIEGIEVDAYGDPLQTVDTTRLNTIRRALASGTICPMYDLMELKEIEFYGREGAKELPWDRNIVYAQSWSLVYYLLAVAEGEDREFAGLVAKRLDTGQWSQAAFKRILPELEGRWRDFLARDDLVRLDVLTTEARRELDQGRFSSAREAALKALDLDRKRRAARRVLAESCVALGLYEEALVACDRLLADEEADPDAHLCRARALLGQAGARQQPDLAGEARAVALHAVDLLPEQEKFRGLLLAIQVDESRDDVKGALELLRRALALKHVPQEVRSDLLEREQALIKRAIGR
ncbi:MAG: tetratricopeptide repeat protein [Planctomycetes bacterium]|nr:tetratricopeptide repeat protein [Planctomycetota bacterium]